MRQVGWSTFKRRSDSTAGRLNVLRQMQPMLPRASTLRSTSETAIERYAWFAEACSLRAGAYGGQSLGERTGCWLKLIACGGYDQRRPWSFGARSMFRDGALGVLLGGGADRRAIEPAAT